MLSFLKKKLQEGLKKLSKNVEQELKSPDEEEIKQPVPPVKSKAEASSKEKQKNSTEKTSATDEKEKFSLTDIFTKKTLSDKAFEDLFWDIEVGLLESNVALEVIEKIKEDLKTALVNHKIGRFSIEKTIKDTLTQSLKEILSIEHEDLIAEIKKKQKKPFILILIGINGSGKTTTVAKLVHLFKKQGLTSVIAACDTFRAAAIHQLEEHAKRLDTKIIKYDYGADASAVAFDAIKHAEAKNMDVVLIDTAGRNHANQNLMDELEKLVRVTNPDKKIFIGDALTGNDAVEQAREFHEKVHIDGIILSKADCDENGGCAVSMSYVTKKPIYYIGCGQNYEDLLVFDAKLILDKLSLEESEEEPAFMTKEKTEVEQIFEDKKNPVDITDEEISDEDTLDIAPVSEEEIQEEILEQKQEEVEDAYHEMTKEDPLIEIKEKTEEEILTEAIPEQETIEHTIEEQAVKEETEQEPVQEENVKLESTSKEETAIEITSSKASALPLVKEKQKINKDATKEKTAPKKSGKEIPKSIPARASSPPVKKEQPKAEKEPEQKPEEKTGFFSKLFKKEEKEAGKEEKKGFFGKMFGK